MADYGDISDSDLTDEFLQFYNCDVKEFGFEELNPIYTELDSADSRYSDFSEVAKGGMKQISRVYDQASGRYVAIAQLHDDAPKEYYEPFLREARLTACLQHPNIIPVYDVGLLGDKPFFTMELKTGQTLSEIVRSDRPLQSDLLNIFLKICDAISYAHSRSVVHLDLKPANIQIGEYGEVMVCDWGLGKIFNESDEGPLSHILNADMLNDMTLTGEIKGTPGFMAPEQIEKNGKKTIQTDVFALGALLYSLLTLQNPADVNLKTTFEKTRTGKLCTFDGSRIAKKVPKSLRAVVTKATAPDPKDRYSQISDLRNDIYKFINGFPTSAENAGLAKQLLLLLRRNSRISLTIFSVVCFTLLITLYSFIQVQQSADIARSERDAARDALDKYTKEKRYSSELVKSYEQSAIGQAILFQTSGLYFDQATAEDCRLVISELDKVLEKSPGNKAAIVEKGRLLVIMQQFQAAAECHRQAQDLENPFITLVEEYSIKYPGNDTLKDPEVIASFVHRIWKRFGLNVAPYTEMMMAYDSIVRTDLSGHSLVVKEVLLNFNPLWNERLFEYNADERHLTVGGRNLERFIQERYYSSKSNALRTLNLKSLTIKCPEFIDLKKVSKLQFETLDIRETGVSTIPTGNSLQQISQIICRKGQFSPEEKAKFPPNIHVIEK